MAAGVSRVVDEMAIGPSGLLTTSWDDGSPCDLRVGEMLTRHGISGTFYVPREAETGTMSPAQLRELARGFEIGAHTLGHAVLTQAAAERARQEIVGSKAWVEDQTGTPCRMFCPPRGRFARDHLAMVRQAGFIGLRSVELASLDYPRSRDGLLVMPTSVQAQPHRASDYIRNVIRRAALRNLWFYLLYGRGANWAAMAGNLLRCAMARGGVFHLWGHSWEIQEAGQWQRLDDVLRMMAACGRRMPSLTNEQVCALTAGMRRSQSRERCVSS
jgi:peptidoglycan-N-acetylglucosamine deacetylase